jgi:hypothetical protein
MRHSNRLAVESLHYQLKENNVAHFNPKPKLKLGRILVTFSILKRVRGEDVRDALLRHEMGDWGEISFAQADDNDDAEFYKLPVVSRYRDEDGKEFLISTDLEKRETLVFLEGEH